MDNANEKPPATQSSFDALTARFETLRDELKLKAHLLGMDARDSIVEIEKSAESLGRKLDNATHEAFGKLIERLEGLMKSGESTAQQDEATKS